MENLVATRIELYPHQHVIMAAKEPRLAIVGGVGSGKSYVAMLRLLAHAIEWPGTHVMCLRAVGADIKRVTIGDFLQLAEEMDVFGKLDKHFGEIWLKNGSRVTFLHAWDPERGVEHLNGYNLSAVMISQVEEVPVQSWRKVMTRMRRLGVLGVSGRRMTAADHVVVVEGNPSARDWVYEEWVAGSEVEERKETVRGREVPYWVHRKPGRLMVRCPTANYTFVPDGYLESVSAGASERYLARYVKGEYVPPAGLVYPCVTDGHWVEPFVFKKERDRGRFTTVVGFDWGFRDPSGVLWGVYDNIEDFWLFYRESYRHNLTVGEQAKLIMDLSEDDPIDVIVADTQLWSKDPVTGKRMVDEFERVLRERGFEGRIVQSTKAIEPGIQAVTKYLRLNKMAFFRNLRHLKNEFDMYRYPEDVDAKEPKVNLKAVPLDKHNHLMDAMRYMVYGQVMNRFKPVYNPEENDVA